MYFGMQMNVFEELCRELSAKVMHPSSSGSVSEVFIKKRKIENYSLENLN